MDFGIARRKPVIQRQPKKQKCEIVIEKTSKGGIRKSIKGNCTREELRALDGHNDLQNTNEI